MTELGISNDDNQGCSLKFINWFHLQIGFLVLIVKRPQDYPHFITDNSLLDLESQTSFLKACFWKYTPLTTLLRTSTKAFPTMDPSKPELVNNISSVSQFSRLLWLKADSL